MIRSAGVLHAISIAVVAYWTVLVVELIGDKAIYTVVSLSTRYSTTSVYAGITAAFMAKMFVAVSLGRAFLDLPIPLRSALTACTLFVTAILLWRAHTDPVSSTGRRAARLGAGGVGAAFAAVFFAEWADVGQISAAALAAQYGTPVAVWSGSTAALMTKGLLALTVGARLRRHLPSSVSRIAAVASCATLGLVALRAIFVR